MEQAPAGTRSLLHALSSLTGDVDELKHMEVGLMNMGVVVEDASIAPLGHDGQVVFGHVAHEQQDVDVPGLPVAREGKRRLEPCPLRRTKRSFPICCLAPALVLPEDGHLVAEGLELFRSRICHLKDLHCHVP